MTQAQQEKLIQQYMKARDAYWESVQRVYEDRKKFIACRRRYVSNSDDSAQ